MRFGTLILGSTLSALFAAPALAGGVGFTISFGNGWGAPVQTCAPARTCVPVQTCIPVQTWVPAQTVCAPVQTVCVAAPVVCAPARPACGTVVTPVVVQTVNGGGWRGGHGHASGHRHDRGRDFGRGHRNDWRRN